MSLEVGLDFSLGGIARKVAQVQAGSRHFGHREFAGEGRPTGNLAWMGSERMLTVNECLGTDAGEVCQKRNRCRQEECGSREPVARETRNKMSQGDARGVSYRRNTIAFGRTLGVEGGGTGSPVANRL
jgi:hypothetical protein